jgi:hypothetical protein
MCLKATRFSKKKNESKNAKHITEDDDLRKKTYSATLYILFMMQDLIRFAIFFHYRHQTPNLLKLSPTCGLFLGLAYCHRILLKNLSGLV